MKAPISWLNEYVEIDVTAETLAKKLVGIGFEVEGIEYQNKTATKVVVCKINEIDKHPNADRLSVCKIDIGSKILQIVTNAKMTVGELVPVALDGAVLVTGQKINAGELRGVHSDGMFCGGEELGLTNDEYVGASNNDVLRLNGEYKLGANVFDEIGFNDVILDVSITANRPDCNSIFKLAKEVAVALKKNWNAPSFEYSTKGSSVYDLVKVEVKNQSLCPRYMAAGVKNIRIAQSPLIIKKRLRAVGIRPINNIVDITNYILIELGQPMHAFDKRELAGEAIVVRNAKENETIVSLDGKLNNLKEDMLVICDAVKPVAIAGIMGGENSGIKEDTKEVIFESARFARDSIRRTSKALNLRSDSSARFEKGVDFALQEYALNRALHLICELDAGDVVEGVIDVSVEFEKFREIFFTMKKISQILGFTVRKQSLVPILRRLGIEVKDNGKELVAIIPGDREDMCGVNDIAEEFIRVYGFGHIPPTLFAHSEMTKGGRGAKIEFIDKVENTLASLGLSQIVNYSFTTPKCYDLLKFPQDSKVREAISLLNPLGEAVSIMRTTMVHSMIETISFNISKFNKTGKLFEVGKVYLPEKLPLEDLPKEEETLCLGIYGDEDFFSLKSIIESLFNVLRIDIKLEKEQICYLHDGRSAKIFANGVEVGIMGELHPDVMENYDVSQRLYVAELSLEKLFSLEKTEILCAPISRYPAVQRDLAVVLDSNIVAGDLIDLISNSKIKCLSKCQVFDVFESEAIGEGKKSVALSFEFVSYDKTMTDEEINEAMKKILSLLQRKFKAKIR
ncbi:MAG: phenylalanine--tRNA ligase subunit beta [Clostridia bacterium]|nr:phenylalanine--tRNA ligase subunit beta [Clostridia bacterium]